VAELTLAAPSKLNLVLRVGPVAPDGYHPLQSLMIALSAPQDTVRVALDSRRRVDCPVAPGPQNLASSALDALEAQVGRALPVAVTITKRIPAQAGLGGGSSDAAAVLRATNVVHACGLADDELVQVAEQVGSDVPFFIRGGTQWAAGRGHQLRTAAPLPGLNVLVVDAGVHLSTPCVYAAFDRAPHEPLPAAAEASPRNDLWHAALSLRPRLGRVVRDLRAAGADQAVLCGSGGAVAGLFSAPERAQRAAAILGPSYRTWVAQPDTPETRAPPGG